MASISSAGILGSDLATDGAANPQQSSADHRLHRARRHRDEYQPPGDWHHRLVSRFAGRVLFCVRQRTITGYGLEVGKQPKADKYGAVHVPTRKSAKRCQREHKIVIKHKACFVLRRHLSSFSRLMPIPFPQAPLTSGHQLMEADAWDAGSVIHCGTMRISFPLRRVAAA